MQPRTLSAVAGVCAAAAWAVAHERQPVCKTAPSGPDVEPVAVARVGLESGRIVFHSDWLDYSPQRGPVSPVRIFDCYGDIDSDGVPDDSGGCGLGSLRWYFGSGFCDLFYTNDMTVVGDTVLDAGATAVDLGWYWTADGIGSSERCIIAVFTQESVPCGPDSFDYEGWLLDFGTLPSSMDAGHYYRAHADLTPDSWRLPTTGTGSYAVFFLQDATTSGSWTLATCAQPMLWATGDHGGAADRVGSSDPPQFEDWFSLSDPSREADGSHSASECYIYSGTSACPYVLGGMAEFWGTRDNECLGEIPNCDRNGRIDSQDFLCYLDRWALSRQSGQYDPGADCDQNGEIDTQDFLCFLAKFAACF
jgi:hypothetical protein